MRWLLTHSGNGTSPQFIRNGISSGTNRTRRQNVSGVARRVAVMTETLDSELRTTLIVIKEMPHVNFAGKARILLANFTSYQLHTIMHPIAR